MYVRGSRAGGDREALIHPRINGQPPESATMANACSPRTELAHLRMGSIFAKPTQAIRIGSAKRTALSSCASPWCRMCSALPKGHRVARQRPPRVMR
jgi:hypothetical protein